MLIRWSYTCLISIMGILVLVRWHFYTESGPWFNIKMTSYQYRKSHCVDKTILRLSYFHNGISYTGKTTSLYWIRTLMLTVRLVVMSSNLSNHHINGSWQRWHNSKVVFKYKDCLSSYRNSHDNRNPYSDDIVILQQPQASVWIKVFLVHEFLF